MAANVSAVIEALERQGAQLDFLRTTTVRIQEADTPEDAIQQTIERVCTFTQWPVGHAYFVTSEGHLEQSPLWYLHDTGRFTSFRKSIDEVTLPDAFGLATRVVDLGEPQWTQGLGENNHGPIARAAEDVGITSAFAFPISAAMTIKAVIEFFSGFEDPPEQSFLEIMAALCIQLGRALERRHAAELEATNRRLVFADARLQEALAAAGKAPQTDGQEENRFLTNMGHEFRTPLTAILGFSELLLAEAASSGQKSQLEDLGRIHDAASGLLELVNGIIDLSSIRTGQLEVNVGPCEIEPLVTELCESMRNAFREKANVLDLRCASDIGAIRTDAHKVRRCLKHILENANKFTESGVVELMVSRLHAPEGDRIVFRVVDTGIGMTREQVSRLFRPFSQADGSAARRYAGAGIGLALVDKLARLLGGHVRVESVLGEGTVCSLELPVATPSPDRDREAETAFPTLAPSHRRTSSCPKVNAMSRPTILVVEDTENNLILITRQLQRRGYEVVTAHDAFAGLSIARTGAPDLILMDIGLPGMDGYEATRKLKDHPATQAMPVIALTAHALQTDEYASVAAGCDDFEVKPIDFARLCKKIDVLLGRATGRVLARDEPID